MVVVVVLVVVVVVVKIMIEKTHSKEIERKSTFTRRIKHLRD